eukprot:PhM_4_TR2053/c3_g1_i2/m.58012
MGCAASNTTTAKAPASTKYEQNDKISRIDKNNNIMTGDNEYETADRSKSTLSLSWGPRHRTFRQSDAQYGAEYGATVSPRSEGIPADEDDRKAAHRRTVLLHKVVDRWKDFKYGKAEPEAVPPAPISLQQRVQRWMHNIHRAISVDGASSPSIPAYTAEDYDMDIEPDVHTEIASQSSSLLLSQSQTEGLNRLRPLHLCTKSMLLEHIRIMTLQAEAAAAAGCVEGDKMVLLDAVGSPLLQTPRTKQFVLVGDFTSGLCSSSSSSELSHLFGAAGGKAMTPVGQSSQQQAPLLNVSTSFTNSSAHGDGDDDNDGDDMNMSMNENRQLKRQSSSSNAINVGVRVSVVSASPSSGSKARTPNNSNGRHKYSRVFMSPLLTPKGTSHSNVV